MGAQRRRSAAFLTMGFVVVLAMLVLSVGAAVQIGGLAGLGRSGVDGRLDYARGPVGGYFPLTDAFLDDALGGTRQTLGSGVPEASGAVANGAPSSSVAGPGRGSAGDVAPPDVTASDLGNDNFANAYAIRGLPFTARSTAPATREPGEPTPCGPPGGGSRWFRYAPRIDIGLLATTSGTELGSSISVYTGSGIGDLTVIGCNGSPNGGNQVPFAAKAGTTYWFQAVKTVGDGALVFSLHLQGTTTLASVSEEGQPAAGDNVHPRVSANGRYVTFASEADLVPGTQNGCVSTHHPDAATTSVRAPGPCRNIYLRDLVARTTTLISTRDGEVGGNDDSYQPAVSADGRYVAFGSYARDLVLDDTNGGVDVFLRDTVARTTTRVSVTSTGAQVTPVRFAPSYTAVSDDGRYVAFVSDAPELADEAGVPRCSAEVCAYVYIRDIRTGRTVLVSRDEDGDPYPSLSAVSGISSDGSRIAFSTKDPSAALDILVVSEWQHRGRVVVASAPTDGSEPDGSSYATNSQSLSADGRRVVFQSDATNLVPGDTNGAVDFFVHDLDTRRTTRVSVASDGSQAIVPDNTTDRAAATTLTAGNPSASISADGRYVAFATTATNLVPGDTNNTYDVFVHDVLRRTTTRVSVLNDGTESPGVSYRGTISRDGRSIAFSARGFVSGQTQTSTLDVYVRQQPVH